MCERESVCASRLAPGAKENQTLDAAAERLRGLGEIAA
jgi:hypothetical protein